MKKISVLFACILATTSCTKDVLTEESVFENTIESSEFYSRTAHDDLFSVIIATENVNLTKENSITGHIDVTSGSGQIKVRHNSYVNGTATAYSVEIDQSSSAEAVTETPSDIEFPTFYYNTLSDSDSPDVIIDDCTVILDGDVYGNVEIQDNACVTFTSANISMNELKMGKNATINFTQGTELLINKRLEFNENSNFNPDLYDVSLFVNDHVKVKRGSNITAYIHANNYVIDVKGEDRNPTIMTGQFIGNTIKGDGSVTWIANTNQIDNGCFYTIVGHYQDVNETANATSIIDIYVTEESGEYNITGTLTVQRSNGLTNYYDLDLDLHSITEMYTGFYSFRYDNQFPINAGSGYYDCGRIMLGVAISGSGIPGYLTFSAEQLSM